MISVSIKREKPLVLIHGWGMHSGVFKGVVQALQQQTSTTFSTHLIDLPGFGVANEVELDKARFLESLADTLPQNAVVLGWSMGGLFATQYALTYPEKVSHLINVCSSPRFSEHGAWPGLSLSELEQFMFKLENDYAQCLNDFLALQLMGHRKYSNQLFPLLHEPEPDKQALHQGLNLLKECDLRADLSRLSIPCWYVFGRLDRIVPPSTRVELQRIAPHFSFTEYRHHAHIPFVTHQQQFVSDLLEFIDA